MGQVRPVNAACGSFSVIRENSSTHLTKLSTLFVMQSCASSTATKYLPKYHKPVFVLKPSSEKKAVTGSTLFLFFL